MEHITSRHNPSWAISAGWPAPPLPVGDGEFLCDSPKLLQEALLWQAEITAVVTISPLPPASGAHPAGAGAGGRHGLHLPVKTPQGVLFHLPPASGSPAPVPHRPAVCAAGRGAGPRQRRHHPADAGRLRRRRPAAHRWLRRPLRLEGGARPWGRVPPPHLFRHTGGTGGPAAPQRPALYGAALREDTVDARQADSPAARWPSAARAVA